MKVLESKGNIMIVKGDHYDRYFLAETKEQVYEICLSLLKEENSEFVIYKPSEPEYDELPIDGERLTGKFKVMYDSTIRRNKMLQESYREMSYMYKVYETAINKNNGILAWKIISECFPAYYEFERLENVK